MAERNHRKREKLACVKVRKNESETKLTNLLWHWSHCSHWGFGIIGYYVSQSKTPKEAPVNQPKEIPVQQPNKTPEKFDMD